MTDAHDIARQAAKRLAAEYGAGLPTAVEKAIVAGGAGELGQFGLVGDLANVTMAIIAAAALGWTISRDLEQDRRLTQDNVKRELTRQLKTPETLAPEKRQQIIIVITDLVIRKAHEGAGKGLDKK